MKTAQWIVTIGFLAALVFGVTFALVYLGSPGEAQQAAAPPPPPADPNLPKLAFAAKVYPAAGGPYLTEHKLPGSADFWFENTEATPIKFGLKGKNCTCTSVEAFFADPEWKELRDRHERSTAAVGLTALVHPSSGLKALKSRETSLRMVKLEPTDEGYEIPPGGYGWIRMYWSGEKEGQQRLRSELWLHHKTGGLVESLDVWVWAFPPVRLKEPFLSTGTIHPGDLPVQLELVCYSPTRPQFALTAEAVSIGATAGTDPFIVGQPIPLTPEELLALEMDEKLASPAKSGYRIPVTLRDQAGDLPFDVGPFRRLVRLTTPGLTPETQLVPVVGTVQGDVKVGSQEDLGRVTFGTFDRAAGKVGRISLTTELEGPTLELVRERVPDYLKVSFPAEPKVTGAGRKVWEITVEVLPGKVHGRFPRDDDAAYRDSAIYVKSHSSPPRLIRIPVEGNAENR